MNRNKDTLKDLFNRLTLQEQNNVINFAYLYDDVRSLRQQLQQKENIIKEVREFAKLRKEMCERQENVVGQEVIISLLNILDKGK